MPRDDTARVIAEIVERVSGGPAARLSPESTFVDDLGIDSFTMMTMSKVSDPSVTPPTTSNGHELV